MKDEIRTHGSMDDEIGRSCGTWYGTLVDLGRGFRCEAWAALVAEYLLTKLLTTYLLLSVDCRGFTFRTQVSDRC